MTVVNIKRLGIKFTALLSAVFLMGLIIGGIVLWEALYKEAQSDITTRGLILMETMTAIRSYTENHVKPLLEGELGKQQEFIQETVPSFSSRTVFDEFRQSQGNAYFSYKEAALNPTNQDNRADSFETEIIDRLRTTHMTEISGFRTRAGEQVYFIARPLIVNSRGCLECHNTPEKAPKTQVETYGSQNGFGWKLGETVAAQVIYVPSETILNLALRFFMLIVAIFSASSAIVLLTLNWLLKRDVIKPITVLGALADHLSANTISLKELESEQLLATTRRSDELGQLSRVFQQMAREVYTREQQMQRRIEQLRIEIDTIKEQEQVAEVVDSDFFRDLQSKAQELRQQRHTSENTTGTELPGPEKAHQ